MKPFQLLARIQSRLRPPRGGEPRRLSRPALDDNAFFGNNASAYYRDRYDYNRAKVLSETLRAWRVNPLARSIVRTITAFVVGRGMVVTSPHRATEAFLREWWNHSLNDLDRQLKRWKDEDTRTGNLFFLFTVDALTGMSYVRAVPADLIEEIQTSENDVEQETYFVRRELGASPWAAYDPRGEQTEFMLHFAANQPVGVAWGEPDLAPMLPWIGRLSSLLEDRARLNYYRNAFMYVVRGRFASAEDKRLRQAEINANPPQPGTVLVLDEGETWDTLSPRLDSFDANADVLAIKKFVAAGVNFPLHWLAEPESSTRTTAEAAGTPTFRNLEEVQRDFITMLERMARTAVEVRKRYDRRVDPGAAIRVQGPDITERDNSLLALAVNRIYPALADLFDRGLLDGDGLLRLVYRMAAETFDAAPAREGVRRAPSGVRAEPESPEESEPE